ncbi:MAG: ribbon-helix-helix protein, CopG family [Rhodospirillales bacterium]|nr:ribbon-helix-helix protein, CopG family [Rhodospirillales bacterium]
MEAWMLSIALSPEMEERLETLMRHTGKSRDEVIAAAVERYLDVMEQGGHDDELGVEPEGC